MDFLSISLGSFLCEKYDIMHGSVTSTCLDHSAQRCDNNPCKQNQKSIITVALLFNKIHSVTFPEVRMGRLRNRSFHQLLSVGDGMLLCPQLPLPFTTGWLTVCSRNNGHGSGFQRVPQTVM